MTTWSNEEFARQAQQWLLLDDKDDTADVDNDALRAWLGEMPQRLVQKPRKLVLASMATWASLTGLLARRVEDETPANPGDVVLLRTLLDHALTVPMHLWLTEGQPLVTSRTAVMSEDDDPSEHEYRPAYDALFALTSALALADAGMGPHPMLTGVFAAGWQPGPLLQHLNQLRPLQQLHMERDGDTVTYTVPGFLMAGMLSAMANSDWRPAPHPTLALLWDTMAHAYYEDDHNGEQSRAAKTMLKTFPQYAGRALKAVQESPRLRKCIDAIDFFPFPFKDSHDRVTLVALVECWSVKDIWRSQKRQELPSCILQHHPDVAHLLDMHCSLYPEPTTALNNVDNITEMFERLVVGTNVPSMNIEHLDLGALPPTL